MIATNAVMMGGYQQLSSYNGILITTTNESSFEHYRFSIDDVKYSIETAEGIVGFLDGIE